MNKFMAPSGKPYMIYGENHIDPKALNQFFEAMTCGFVVQGAVMPDAHFGYSLPIGGVVATSNTVVPAWVGYDIGCGMFAMKMDFDAHQVRANRDQIFDEIYESVPVGFKHNKAPVGWGGLASLDCTKWFFDMYRNRGGDKQLGTLGGGNHFIEIGVGNDEHVWIIIHSGSRGIGHTTATEYMKIASGTKKAKEGHFGLVANSDIGKDYIKDMNFCLRFALKNRQVIADRVWSVINNVLECKGNALSLDPVRTKFYINRTHNHAVPKVNEDGTNVWIHRKGATHAEKGMLGVIPGNMRDGSFVVRGKGCAASLNSSSHGAGRVMSRRQATDTIDFDEWKYDMLQSDIKAKIERSTIDEAPEAYKPINQVMEDQKDLVEVITEVKPLINIKG